MDVGGVYTQERIQKLISEAGIASRREAEHLIARGLVTVNGKPAIIGQKADPDIDKIKINGNPLTINGKRVYIMLYKPRGYVTTMKDEMSRKTVRDLMVGCRERVYPVGRLDKDSEGLLIMTNDGELANKLMHPKFHISKKYEVKVKGERLETAAKRLGEKMIIEGVELRPAKVQLIERTDNSALLSVEIYEGKNRQIRKMCELAELEVIRLKRVSQGELELGSLKPGAWRYLDKHEIEYLKKI